MKTDNNLSQGSNLIFYSFKILILYSFYDTLFILEIVHLPALTYDDILFKLLAAFLLPLRK